ncbi:MAG TPA: pantetheine-phosphate adenylyltransferase [Peptococcaceae bacterium]|nr:pantetheine-phosphate adenylyltransferase [Peptococcaceae bacterium]
MSIAIYPGSFDPMTMGHIHIAERACRIFDHVIIGVAIPNYKSSLFTLDERMEFLKEGIAHIPNCSVQVFDCLTVDFAKQVGAVAIIRGLRAISDYEYEMQVAAINKYLAEGVETVFLMANSEYSFLSSSIIKQVVSTGGKVTGLVTPRVEKALTAKLYEGKLKATENI